MSVRDLLRRSGRALWRLLLWTLLVLVVVTLPILVMLGTDTGSRWLLEQGLGMQKALVFQVKSGSLLTGMELHEVRLHTRKTDLYIRHVLARWSLVSLLRGEVDITHLQAEGVTLTFTSPPSRDPVRLPRLILPVTLNIHSLVIRDALVQKRGKEWPVAWIAARGRWEGANVYVQRLQAREPLYGVLDLHGRIRLLGGYPLQASGQLSPRWLTEKGWKALQVKLTGEVASLDVQADSSGNYVANLAGNVQPLLPDIPYRATLDWSDLNFPWWSDQSIQSKSGQLQVLGDKNGLRSQGQMQMTTRHSPPGQYRWQLQTDWQEAKLETFVFNGLGGEINAKGRVSWRSGLGWDLSATLNRIDASRHWPVTHSVLPVLTGTLISKGVNGRKQSAVDVHLQLANGERWTLKDAADGVLWSASTKHKLSATWAFVKRQVPGVRTLQSDAGKAQLTGNREAYELDFEAGMTTEVFPSGIWTGRVRERGRQLLVERLDYEGDAGRLQAHGSVDYRKGLSWQGVATLENFNTGWVRPEWYGQFSGHLAGSGRWDKQAHEANFESIDLDGQLRDQPITLTGPLQLSFPQGHWPRVYSTGFSAQWGGNFLYLKGGLSESWDANAEVVVADASTLDPRLRGRLNGNLQITGAERSPDIKVDLTADHPGFGAYSARTAYVKGNLAELGAAPGHLEAGLSGMTNSSGAELGNLQVVAEGGLAEHQVSWVAEGSPVGFTGLMTGQFDQKQGRWSGFWQQGQVETEDMIWALAQPTALEWLNPTRQLRMAHHCWQSEPASLCASEEVLIGPEGNVAFQLKGMQAERLSGLLPEGLVWLGAIDGDVQGSWLAGQSPIANASLETTGGEFRLARDDSEPLVLGYERLALKLDADQDSVRAHAQIDSTDLGQGFLDAAINPYAEGHPLTGDVALRNMRLEILQPFLPALSVLTGRVSAEGRLDGVLAKPRFWGEVQLDDGRFAIRNSPVIVDEMSARIDVLGDKADISGQLKSGSGGATLTGQGDWTGEPRLELALKGDRFSLRQEPQLIAEISPDLYLVLVPGQLTLNGTVRVPYARINLKSVPARTVSLSPDVEIIETEEGQLRARIARKSKGIAIYADVELALGDDVFFNGYGVIGGLNGGMRLRQSPQRGLEAVGEIGLDKESRYEAYGQKLKVRHGQLVFAGNITQPGIDAEAIKEVDDKIVGISVQGRANAPEATLFSEPAMAQEEMLSYLILGRPLASRSQGNNDAMLAAAAIKLGARGGQGLTSGIGNVLGVQDLSLDADGSGDDTQVKVSGYLSPDLYLSYGVGVFTPVNKVTLRYQIRPKLYLEAVSSLENAIDLFYNFRF